MPNYRWTVVVDRPVAEALAPAINARNLAIGGLGLSILLSVIAALLLSGNLTRPVRDLAVAVRALGEGNSNIVLPVHKPADDEISTLRKHLPVCVLIYRPRRAAIRKQGSAMEAASDGMAILDPNLHFEYVNGLRYHTRLRRHPGIDPPILPDGTSYARTCPDSKRSDGQGWRTRRLAW